MTAKFEKVETNKVVLTFEISQEDIKKGLDQAFNRVKKNVNVPGFRKGKVSRQVFEKMYGEEALYQDALNNQQSILNQSKKVNHGLSKQK